MSSDSRTRIDTDGRCSFSGAEKDTGPIEQWLHAILVEQRRDWTTGQRTPAAEWLWMFPVLAADPAQAAKVIYHEYLLRREVGEAPLWDEYPRQFPQYADNLQRMHQADRIVEPIAASATPAKLLNHFGDYELLEQIGRGGMGVVHKARQKSLDRIVAVKMIRAESHPTEEERKRLGSEARTVARLCHPNIVQIYEVGEVAGQPFIALEFVEGGSLEDRLDGTPFPARQAAVLLEVLARAMHHAHEKGVIHRDLKPSNVLLVETPNGVVPKVTDFGLAKRLDIGGDTRSGAILGTPSYMAPEQAESRGKSIDPRTDVYGLGALLYELLTGRPPFRSESLLQTLEQVSQREPVAPNLLNPAVPRDLETVCLKTLQKEPERRYASAAELAEDLARWLRGEPVKARRIGLSGRVWRWCRRKPLIANLVAALALALLMGILGILYQWRETEVARREAEASDEQAQQLLNELLQPSVENPLEMGRSHKLPDLETLHRAESHFAGLLQKRPGDTRIRVALTNVRGSLGSLYAFRGRMDETKVHLEAARELWEELARRNPRDPVAREWLAATSVWLSSTAYKQGNFARRVQLNRRAYCLWQELVEEQPDNRAYMRNLINRRFTLLALRDGGPRCEETLGALEEERASLRARLSKESPANPALRKELALVHLILGEIHRGIHSTSKAIPCWRQAYEEYRTLAREQPDDLLIQLNLALCCCRLMADRSSDPFYQEAVALFERAVDRLLALAPKYSQGDWPQATLLQTYALLALCHWKAARTDRGDHILQERIRPLAAQVSEYQADHERSFGWLDRLLRTADLLEKNKPPAALALAREAASLAERYANSPSRNPTFCEILVRDTTRLSAILCRLGDPTEALRQAECARRLGEALRRTAPEVPEYGDRLSAAWERIAKARWALDQRDEALVAFEEAAAVQRRVVEQAPSVLLYRVSLSRCYERLTDWGSRRGNRAVAAAALRDRARLWPDDKKELLAVARDYQSLSELVGKDRETLSPEEESERQHYRAECRRLMEAARQTTDAGPNR